MKRLLEAVDKAQFAGEKEGQKPGDQWRGDDKKTPGKKLVGEENVFKELDSHVKENAVERRLKTQLAEFKQGVAEGKFEPINDDDYYEYNINTKEIVNRISGKHPEARKFNPLQREWPGRDEDHKFVLGLKAKHLKSKDNMAEDEKIGGKYDPEEFDAMVSRLGQKAKQGPMKTVWDPIKRVYKNVPVNQNKQAVKEYGNAQDPDNQKTTPGAAGSAQQDQEDDIGAKLGAQATNQSINALKAIEPNLNPTLAKQTLAKGDMPATMSSAETGQAKELSDLLGTALGNPQTSSQVTALLRKAAQLKGK